jgi:branched-chain amino acid transport system permease protein
VSTFVEFLIHGVLVGVTYGLLAIPLTLVYTTTDTVDLAVGGYAVLSGALASVVGGVTGVLVGLGAGVLAAATVGTLFVILARAGAPDPVTVVLATFGFSIALASVVLWSMGSDPFVARAFTEFWQVGTIRVSPQGAINLGLAVGMLVGLLLLLYRTSLGRAMRASAVNAVGAGLAGIPVRRVQFLTFVSGGLMAAAAGVLVLYTTGMDYTSVLQLGLLAIGSALVFGMRPMRAFAGGIAIGVVEALAGGYISGGWSAAIPLLFILVMLASGRLGRLSAAEVRP